MLSKETLVCTRLLSTFSLSLSSSLTDCSSSCSFSSTAPSRRSSPSPITVLCLLLDSGSSRLFLGEAEAGDASDGADLEEHGRGGRRGILDGLGDRSDKHRDNPTAPDSRGSWMDHRRSFYEVDASHAHARTLTAGTASQSQSRDASPWKLCKYAAWSSPHACPPRTTPRAIMNQWPRSHVSISSIDALEHGAREFASLGQSVY